MYKSKILKIVVLMIIVGIVASFSLFGCKVEAEEATEEVTEETIEEVTEETIEEEAEEEEVAEEAPKLGTEGLTYWIDKAGITPSGELTIYSYKDEGVTEWKIAQKYAETYPDVTINWVGTPYTDYANKILLECQTGTQAFDVFWCNSFWSTTFHDYLEDVTDRIPEELRNDISPGIISCIAYKDAWYGAPIFISTGSVVYNKDMLKQAGYDTPPTTWDEFFKCAEDLVIDKDNDGIPEVHGYTGLVGEPGYFLMYPVFLESVGGHFWNKDEENPQPMFNSDEGKRALQILKRLYMSDFSDPVMLTADDMSTRRSIASGKVAMGIECVGSVDSVVRNDFPENEGMLGWSVVPSDPGYDSWSFDGSMGFAMSKGANIDAALGYILFYSSPEMQKFMTEDYGFPSARISLAEDEEYVADYPFVPTAVEQVKNTDKYIAENVGMVQGSFFPIFENYFMGKINEETALSQMEDAFNEAWEE